MSRLRIALVEAQDLDSARQWRPLPDTFANRTSSLTPASVRFLHKTGVWAHIEQGRVQPYGAMEVWDAATDARIGFGWDRLGGKQDKVQGGTVATMAENANIVRAMLTRIDELESTDSHVNAGGVDIFSNTYVNAIDNGADYVDGGPDLSAWPVLTLSSPAGGNSRPIAARLLIGADGINSPVRKFAGIEADGWDYDRRGVVATLKLDQVTLPDSTANDTRSTPMTAFQRFLPSLGGPIAVLPFPHGHASLVWSTTPSHAAYLTALPPRALAAMVTAALHLSQTDLDYLFTLPPSSPSSPVFGADDEDHPVVDEVTWRLQHTRPPPSFAVAPPTIAAVHPGTAAAFPLRLRHAAAYVRPRIALVGDAAHVIHPLAGQGLNSGLGDVEVLADVVARAACQGIGASKTAGTVAAGNDIIAGGDSNCAGGGDIGALLALEPYATARYASNATMGLACDGIHRVFNGTDSPAIVGYGLSGDGRSGVWPGALMRGLGMKVVDFVPGLKELIMRRASGM